MPQNKNIEIESESSSDHQHNSSSKKIKSKNKLKRKTRLVKLLSEKLLIGWNEWCALPDLNIPAIKAKIDTGAKTSAIHASNIEIFKRRGKPFVKFTVFPLQANTHVKVHCVRPVVDERHIMSSNGHIEHRYVISTPLQLGRDRWDIEVTLSNRDPLTFRMLLGRDCLEHRVVIDPSRALYLKKLSHHEIENLYRSVKPGYTQF